MAPTPYHKRKSAKIYYRQPAYLLTTDLRHSAPQLLQIYFDRWQIEVNHRDEKDTLGVGQAPLWNINAVPKQPVLVVTAYSALLLASLQAFGTERTQAYPALPRWRRKAHRPSCLDLVTLLRKEMAGSHTQCSSECGLLPWRETLRSIVLDNGRDHGHERIDRGHFHHLNHSLPTRSSTFRSQLTPHDIAHRLTACFLPSCCEELKPRAADLRKRGL